MRYNGGAQDTRQERDTQHLPPQPERALAHTGGWSDAKRFTILDVIGKGSYGVVCAAVDNLTKERVAIKKIQNVFDNVADAQRILREIKLLRLLKHPDIVEAKHIMLPSDPTNYKDIYVVFELMESDLHTVIGANDDLTRDHHKVFLYQLLRGLNFMHASGVLHRDLKPKNILANSNCKLKICDFGLARPYVGGNQPMSPVLWTDYVATRWYRAPELCGCFYGRYTQAVDMWSIGCIFAEVLLGKPLFPGRDAVSQLQLITDLLGKPSPAVIDRISNVRARQFLNAMPNKEAKSLEHKMPNADPLALNLLQRMLSFDPSERPTAAEALAHPYFAGLPNAVTQEPVAVAPHFDFEHVKLTEADVRQLIYMEVLHYHPQVMAAYEEQLYGSGRSMYAALLDPPAADVMYSQFSAAEHHQQGAAATMSRPAAHPAAAAPQAARAVPAAGKPPVSTAATSRCAGVAGPSASSWQQQQQQQAQRHYAQAHANHPAMQVCQSPQATAAMELQQQTVRYYSAHAAPPPESRGLGFPHQHDDVAAAAHDAPGVAAHVQYDRLYDDAGCTATQLYDAGTATQPLQYGRQYEMHDAAAALTAAHFYQRQLQHASAIQVDGYGYGAAGGGDAGAAAQVPGHMMPVCAASC